MKYSVGDRVRLNVAGAKANGDRVPVGTEAEITDVNFDGDFYRLRNVTGPLYTISGLFKPSEFEPTDTLGRLRRAVEAARAEGYEVTVTVTLVEKKEISL